MLDDMWKVYECPLANWAAEVVNRLDPCFVFQGEIEGALSEAISEIEGNHAGYSDDGGTEMFRSQGLRGNKKEAERHKHAFLVGYAVRLLQKDKAERAAENTGAL